MKIVSNLVRRIGACSKCMHDSFLAAVASWGFCLLAGLVGLGLGSYLPIIAAAVVAGMLTLLWLLHLTVFAARRVLQIHSEGAERGVAPIANVLLPRRVFVSRFATAFIGAALATGFTRRQAFAQQQWYVCGGAFCGGNACCPATHPMLNHCDCKCYQQSSDFNNCGSYNQCALDGSNCQG